MNSFYKSFVEQGKSLAEKHGLAWDLPLDSTGNIQKGARWDLAKICGLAAPPYHWLSSLGFDANSLEKFNEDSEIRGLPLLDQQPMPKEWRFFYQATILNEILVKRNAPSHALLSIGRPIRILAICAGKEEPWDISATTVQKAYNVALTIGSSGKMAANLAMMVRLVLDGCHIANHYPLGGFCKAFNDDVLLAAEKAVSTLKKGNNTYRNTAGLRSELSERKGSGKLPNHEAFIALANIVFNKKPLSFSDAIRFSQIKVGIITGFRIGENVMLPVDWARWHDYVDQNGIPAGKNGGISKSLSIRNFAEKQVANIGIEGFFLYENIQHVPSMFEDALIETLNEAEQLTRPLRERLRRQVETNRLFPEYEPQDLVALPELYTRTSGSIRVSKAPFPEDLVKKYRQTYDNTILNEIYELQMSELDAHGPHRQVFEYWERLDLKHGLVFRGHDGQPHKGMRRHSHLKIQELEEFIRKNIPTKLPETSLFKLDNGKQLNPADLMFLMPIRGLADERDGGILDVNRYFSIGRSLPQDLHLHLGGNNHNNIFTRYGESDRDKSLRLNTHSLRHLQNAVLFQNGVSESIITKRFNRRSIAQSHVYNHSSLAEDLANIDLPPDAEKMAPRAQDVFRMIKANKISGPLINEFKTIQKTQGDEIAFSYLSAEADGLHVTPYGFCVNSFVADPCPKHLECYNGCRHLTRSLISEEHENLEKLRDRMIKVVERIEETPTAAQKIGWQNQRKHAIARIENIEKALSCKPGEHPFPDGPDLYRPVDEHRGVSIMDVKPEIWRPE